MAVSIKHVQWLNISTQTMFNVSTAHKAVNSAHLIPLGTIQNVTHVRKDTH
jgi:hypothetical protein